MKKNIRYVFLVSVVLLCSFSLACCKNQGGKVTAYTTLNEELARDFFKAFTDETGIKVDWIRLSTGECVARMTAERENPQASIWIGGVGLGHIEARNKGLTVPYKSPNAKMPPKFRDKEYYWTGLYAGPLCFESNSVRLEQYGLQPPQSWAQLADPAYRDHVQISHPGSSGTSYNILSTLVQLFGEDGAFEYLGRLHLNITQYTRSGMAPGKNMSIGEVAIAVGYAHDGLRFKNEGYPVILTFPEEGTGYEIASVSMIKNAPSDEYETAVKLFDWCLGESAGRIFASYFVVPFADVPLPDGILPVAAVNTIDQDDEWAAANRQRLIEKWHDLIVSGGSSEIENRSP